MRAPIFSTFLFTTITMTSARQTFDVLRATAVDLRTLLDAGSITSVEIVQAYLAQIARHNHDGLKLNAVISTAPESFLLEEARALDLERQKSGPRSRLHGIPILLKDQFCTPSFNLPTTGGTLACQGYETKEDAAIPLLLRKAGSIIIAMANLSELGNIKGYNITSGWSPVGGQTQSPYIDGGVDPKGAFLGHTTPAGSSSGSAVGVAAGFAPVSIGTELDGSIVQPAMRCALYGFKPAAGATDLRGSQAEGSKMTGIGPIARTTKDLADVTAAIVPGADFDSSITGSWDGIRIAVLDPIIWHYPDGISESNPDFDKQSKEEMDAALAKAESLGAKIIYNAPLITPDELIKNHGAPEMGSIGTYEIRPTLENFFANFINSPVRTLEDFIQFSKDHAAEELPGNFNQLNVEKGAACKMTAQEYEEGFKLMTTKWRENVDQCLRATKADLLVASGESILTTVAMAAGYPIACAPLGFANFNGRPFGIEVMSRNGEEGRIFQFLSAWEVMMPGAVKAPPSLTGDGRFSVHAEL